MNSEIDLINETPDERRHLQNFIEVYEQLPELWDPRNPSYSSKSRRIVALDKLVDIYIKIKPKATRFDVRKKINTLRSNFRLELKKIVTSREALEAGDEEKQYQPTSWVFYALRFLSNLKQTEAIVKFVEVLKDNRKLNCNRSTNIVAPLTVNAVSHSFISDCPQSSHTVKRLRSESIGKQNLLEKACSSFGQPMRKARGDIPTIARAWGEKLDTLEPQQRALAERAINEVFFEASQGTLHRYSVRINWEDHKPFSST